MGKLHEKIMKTDFAKSLRRLIVLALCVMLFGGGLSLAMWQTQIGEAISYAKQWEQGKAGVGENAGQNGEANAQSANGEQNSETNAQSANGEQNGENDGEVRWRGEREERGHGERDFFENAVFTRPTAAAVIAVGATVLCGVLFLALFWILVAAWLYQAAVRSGMNGLLWMAAGLIGNVYAAAAFLLIRSFTRAKCPACGAYLPSKAQHCANCGAAMRETCAGCGEICASRDQFCHACGRRLHQDSDVEMGVQA